MLPFLILYWIGIYVGPIILICLLLWGIYALVTNLGSVCWAIVDSMPWIISWIFKIILSILGFFFDCIVGIFWFLMSFMGLNSDNFGPTIWNAVCTSLEYFFIFLVALTVICRSMQLYKYLLGKKDKCESTNSDSNN